MRLLVGAAGGNSTAAMTMVANIRLSMLWYAAALGLPFFPNLSRRVSVCYYAPP